MSAGQWFQEQVEKSSVSSLVEDSSLGAIVASNDQVQDTILMQIGELWVIHLQRFSHLTTYHYWTMFPPLIDRERLEKDMAFE